MNREAITILLRLYPPEYRAEFGDEMLGVLRQSMQEAQGQGRARWLARLLSESRGLVSGAAREHLRQRFGKYPWFQRATRRLSMRSEFRYPRAAAPMMTLIFAIIVFAIYKARSVEAATGLEMEPSHYLMAVTFGLAFMVAALAGAAGWFILHTLHQSGVHRLSAAETWPEAK